MVRTAGLLNTLHLMKRPPELILRLSRSNLPRVIKRLGRVEKVRSFPCGS